MRSVCRQSWIITQIIAEVRLYRHCILVPFNVSFYERLQNLAFYFIIFAQPPFIADTLGTTSVVSLSSLLGNDIVNNYGYGFGKMTLLLNGKSVLTILQCTFNMCQLIMASFKLQCLWNVCWRWLLYEMNLGSKVIDRPRLMGKYMKMQNPVNLSHASNILFYYLWTSLKASRSNL